MDDIAFLLSKSSQLDDIGNIVLSEEKRKVLVQVTSVSSREFVEASTLGNKPEWRLLLFAGDYEGEEFIELRGNVYRIYRTYFNEAENNIELYLVRRLSHGES